MPESRKPTKQRLALTDALAAAPEFVTAQDLHARLRSGDDTAKIGLATVYRNLSAMVEDGVVDVLRADDGEARYRLCSTEAHHHHLVCRECGRAEEVEGPEVEAWAAAVARSHGFTEVTHTLEVFGRCSACSG